MVIVIVVACMALAILIVLSNVDMDTFINFDDGCTMFVLLLVALAAVVYAILKR